MTVRRPDPAQFAAAVDSVLGQSLPDFELVVLENEPAGEVAAALEGRRDPRIRHLPNPGIESLAAARNRCLAQARGELVAIFDADDVCEPERLERQRAFLQAHPEVAVAGSQLAVIDAEGRHLGYRRYPVAHEDILRAMPRYNPIAQPAVMARAAALRSVGGYRADYQGTCEDYDLWSRMALADHRFANLPEPLLRYRLHGGSTKTARLRANLRDTLWIKRHYWGASMGLGDRLRAAGERCLLGLPAPVVAALFRRTMLCRRLPGGERV